MPTTYLTRDGDVLDAICAAHYGAVNLSARVTQALEANQGLAEKGAIYPAGITIILPDDPVTVDEPAFRLWD